MNDCLADAVIYTGSAGEQIRAWMRRSVCEALGGRFAGPASCDVPPGVDTTQTILVAESLGSKVLFDAIRALWLGTPQALRAGFERELGKVQLVFMAANQIPILDTAEDRQGPVLASRAARGLTSSQSTVGALVDVLSEARRNQARAFRQPSATLQIVAFTDPNDLLSYRLTPAAVDNEDVKIANVIVSNAPTYLGLLERPDSAHCGYAGNPYVIGTIVNGYREDLRPASVQASQTCGFGP
jgi:hypothetical protein